MSSKWVKIRGKIHRARSGAFLKSSQNKGEKMVDEKGNLMRFASRKGLPSRDLSRNMREILSLKILWFAPLPKIKKAGQE
jgi:hypothetical protein